METNRQKKIGGVIQRDLAEILQNELRNAGVSGILISVSKVTVTTDLSQAKAYLSIFPTKSADAILKDLKEVKPKIKHELAQRTKHQSLGLGFSNPAHNSRSKALSDCNRMSND